MDLERIQKIVLKIILDRNFVDYDTACKSMSTSTLQFRRRQLALTFALRCLQNKQHKHLFKQRTSTYYKLRNIKSFELPHCYSQRYFSSPVPAMTRLLNEYFEQKGPGSFWNNFAITMNYRYIMIIMIYLIIENKSIWFDLVL